MNKQNAVRFKVPQRHIERIKAARKNHGEISRMMNTRLTHFRNSVYKPGMFAKGGNVFVCFQPNIANRKFLKSISRQASMAKIMAAALDAEKETSCH